MPLMTGGQAVVESLRAEGVKTIFGLPGLHLTLPELATCVKYGLDLITIVYNDNCLGTIRNYQESMFGRTGEVDLSNPDFVALARAFGAHGLRASSPQEVPDAVAEALRLGGPAVVELAAPLSAPWR